MSTDSFIVGQKVRIANNGTDRVYKLAAKHNDGQVLLTDPDTGNIMVSRIAASRLEAVPVKTEDRDGFLGTGDIRMTPDEATEWFTFLMLQAANTFCATPSNVAETRAEVARLLTIRGEHEEGPCYIAAMAYFDAAAEWYRKDEEKHP